MPEQCIALSAIDTCGEFDNIQKLIYFALILS